MTFDAALECLHKGDRVRRGWWENEYTFFEKDSLGDIKFFHFEAEDDAVFNSDDVLADDWVVTE